MSLVQRNRYARHSRRERLLNAAQRLSAARGLFPLALRKDRSDVLAQADQLGSPFCDQVLIRIAGVLAVELALPTLDRSNDDLTKVAQARVRELVCHYSPVDRRKMPFHSFRPLKLTRTCHVPPRYSACPWQTHTFYCTPTASMSVITQREV